MHIAHIALRVRAAHTKSHSHTFHCVLLCAGISGGYAGRHPLWAMRRNLHCESGCLKAFVPRCGTAPAKPPGPPPHPSPPPSPIPPNFPRYVGPRPSVKINASAGLRPIANVEHVTVYNATRDGQRNPFGVYDHGPIITKYMGSYYMSWYNAPEGEDLNKRSVYATAPTARGPWSTPMVLFPTFTASDHGINKNGEENGPWTIIGGRLYSQSGSNDAGEHHEDIISVMRQVGIDGNTSSLGATLLTCLRCSCAMPARKRRLSK